MVVTNNIRYEPLPGKLFKVRVPMIATYTPEEISLYGMNVNIIDGRADMSSIYAPTLVQLPLDRIIDIYTEGYRPITLVDRKELEEIYTILDNYVRGLASTNNFMINTPGIVEERLYDIERFAAEIFDNNKVAILKQSLKFKHGWDVDVNTMSMNQVTTPVVQDQNYNYGYENHMSGYNTVLSGGNINQSTRYSNTSSYNTEPVGNTVADSYRVNPNKPDVVGGYTYINKNLPEIDYDAIKREKTIIKLKQ